MIEIVDYLESAIAATRLILLCRYTYSFFNAQIKNELRFKTLTNEATR